VCVVCGVCGVFSVCVWCVSECVCVSVFLIYLFNTCPITQ